MNTQQVRRVACCSPSQTHSLSPGQGHVILGRRL
jgi:hypothetical protein